MEKLNGFSAAQKAAKVLRKSPLLTRGGQYSAEGAQRSGNEAGNGRLRGPPPLLVVEPPDHGPHELGRADSRRDHILMSVFAAAVHSERQRLARALHDELAQSLFVARLRLSTIVLTNLDDAIADALRAIGECLASSSKATREMMAELSVPLEVDPSRPAFITGTTRPRKGSSRFSRSRQSLRAWIIAVGRRVEREHGLRVVIEGTCACEPATDARLEIGAAVRELLINIVKHAQVSQARVYISGDEHAVTVRVEDEGVGFKTADLPVHPTSEGGFGLPSVRDSLAEVGGRLQLTSAVGHGTVAALLVPVTRVVLSISAPAPAFDGVAPPPPDQRELLVHYRLHLHQPVTQGRLL